MYKIIHEENNLVLARSKLLIALAWIIRIFGLLLLPALIAIPLDPSQDFAWIMGGMSLVFLSASFITSAYAKKLPGKIILDRKASRIRIIENNLEQAHISFSDVESVRIRHMNRRSIIYLRRKNGALFDLFSINSRKKGEKQLSIISEYMADRSAEVADTEMEANSPDKIMTGSGALFSWVDRLTPGAAFFIIALFAGFAAIIYGSMMDENPWLRRALLGGFALFSLYALYSIIRSLFFKNGLLINSKEIQKVFFLKKPGEYSQSAALTDGHRVIKKKKAFPLDKLHAIQYNFDTSRGVQNVYFLSKDEFDSLEEFYSKGLNPSRFFEIIKLYINLFECPLFGLNVSEGLQFEKAILEEIRSYRPEVL